MRAVAHWDDIPAEKEEAGPIGGTWQELASSAGAVRLGVNRLRMEPGKASSPLHAEDEEVFYILSGFGWSVQEDGCFAIGAGDVVFYRAYEIAHTVVAGDDGLSFIAFGTSDPPRGLVRFPRIQKVKVVDVLVDGDRTHQWELEGALERIAVKDPPDDRPRTIRAAAEAPTSAFGPTTARWLTKGLGARGIALNRADIGPGGAAAPTHCHSHEEELFVVIEGGGVARLGDSEHDVRPGSVVGRPPGTGVAHGFRAGDDGMVLLMFSDKQPGDMTYYPDTGKVTFRSLGITIQPEIVPWG